MNEFLSDAKSREPSSEKRDRGIAENSNFPLASTLSAVKFQGEIAEQWETLPATEDLLLVS